MNELITEVYVEQPLASPGSANNPNTFINEEWEKMEVNAMVRLQKEVIIRKGIGEIVCVQG